MKESITNGSDIMPIFNGSEGILHDSSFPSIKTKGKISLNHEIKMRGKSIVDQSLSLKKQAPNVSTEANRRMKSQQRLNDFVVKSQSFEVKNSETQSTAKFFSQRNKANIKNEQIGAENQGQSLNSMKRIGGDYDPGSKTLKEEEDGQKNPFTNQLLNQAVSHLSLPKKLLNNQAQSELKGAFTPNQSRVAPRTNTNSQFMSSKAGHTMVASQRWIQD